MMTDSWVAEDHVIEDSRGQERPQTIHSNFLHFYVHTNHAVFDIPRII